MQKFHLKCTCIFVKMCIQCHCFWGKQLIVILYDISILLFNPHLYFFIHFFSLSLIKSPCYSPLYCYPLPYPRNSSQFTFLGSAIISGYVLTHADLELGASHGREHATSLSMIFLSCIHVPGWRRKSDFVFFAIISFCVLQTGFEHATNLRLVWISHCPSSGS